MPEHWFTRKEAAAACSVHLDTLKRRQRAGQFPNATQTDGIWTIPYSDLTSVGLQPGKPTPPDPRPAAPNPDQPEVGELRATVEGLRGQLDERQTRIQEVRAAAEAQIETVRGHMLAIEQSKNTAEKRVIDLTDTNKRLDERLTYVEHAELETSKAALKARHDANRQITIWQVVAGLSAAAFVIALITVFAL